MWSQFSSLFFCFFFSSSFFFLQSQIYNRRGPDSRQFGWGKTGHFLICFKKLAGGGGTRIVKSKPIKKQSSHVCHQVLTSTDRQHMSENTLNLKMITFLNFSSWCLPIPNLNLALWRFKCPWVTFVLYYWNPFVAPKSMTCTAHKAIEEWSSSCSLGMLCNHVTKARPVCHFSTFPVAFAAKFKASCQWSGSVTQGVLVTRLFCSPGHQFLIISPHRKKDA